MTFNAVPVPDIYRKLPPNAAGTTQFMGRLGYSLEEALADIVDNSIDAKAKTVAIRLVRDGDKISHVVIADDGHGITDGELHDAMVFGVQSRHASQDLGRYGIGLKAASLSQCQSLAVLSKKGGLVSGRTWTREMMQDEWRVGVLTSTQCEDAFHVGFSGMEVSVAHGTIVIWDRLDGMLTHSSLLIDGLVADLGVRFHRFIQAAEVSIAIEITNSLEEAPGTVYAVEAIDPFGYGKTGRKGFPLAFKLQLGTTGGETTFEATAHIWPPRQKHDRNFNLGRKGQIASRQGFYFYRNRRLIKGGGWHQLKGDGEPHSSLARVMIDIPPEMDSFFRLTVQKNDFKVPEEFINAVKKAESGTTRFQDYLNAAEEAYRNAPLPEEESFSPGDGIPSALVRRLEGLFMSDGGGKPTAVEFVWDRLPDDRVFEIRFSPPAIVLNKVFRDKITGDRNSGADAPFVKVLIFLLVQQVFSAKRVSSNLAEWIEFINSALLLTLGQMR